MILVDSSIWIEYFRGTATPETDKLDSLLGEEFIVTGDLVLTEVLQGFRNDRDFKLAKSLMTSLGVLSLGGEDIAIQAAKNYRYLRSKGVTVRKTIDTLIATGCIEYNIALLFTDRDFEPFIKHLGLRSAMDS